MADFVARGELLGAMQAQVRRVGGCEQPIRMRGRVDLLDTVTGEVREAWSSQGQPDGTVLVACGNRRASRCGPCSRLYQGDSYQLIVSGLSGGKGVPDSVTAHPALFVTLTAPAFGAVHSTRLGGRCHPRDGVCDHGRARGCFTVHDAQDPALGQPVCADCFDYEAAVLWNAHAAELWRRTRIAITRHLARLRGVTERQVKAQVRLSYVKVAEYQRRGLLHFHLAVRLDHAAPGHTQPPDGYTADLLAAAITAAVASTEVPYPAARGAGQGHACEAGSAGTLDAPAPAHNEATGPLGVPYPAQALPALDLHERPALRAARWGEQLDLSPIPTSDTLAEAAGVLSRGQVAGYLAKYATKHTEALGAALDRRVRAEDLPTLAASSHVTRLVATALLLASRYPRRTGGRPLNLDRWAHQLGYGGHWLTKSRRWSTTYTALRTARKEHQAARNPDPTDQPGEHEQRQPSWQLADLGYRLQGDALLAQHVRNDNSFAREELRQLLHEEQITTALAA